jgi:hypothetical protein
MKSTFGFSFFSARRSPQFTDIWYRRWPALAGQAFGEGALRADLQCDKRDGQYSLPAQGSPKASTFRIADVEACASQPLALVQQSLQCTNCRRTAE